MTPKKIMVLCEDTYGTEFFKELINRLKNEKFISADMHVNAERFCGPCNTKLERQMKPMAMQRGYNFFMIVADADGKPVNEIKEKIKLHIPDNLKNKIHIVILEYEIEEWVCISLDMKIDNKPSKTLKHKFNYQKYKLKEYVPKLDFKKLKKCNSFNDFLKGLI
jgi:hypothetical protein